MLKKILVVIAILLVLAPVFAMTYEQALERDFRFQSLNKLELSQQQTDKIEKIKLSYKNQIGSLINDLEAKRSKLQQLESKKSSSSSTEIKAVNNQIMSIQMKLSDSMVEMWNKTEKVLTPAQKNKLNSL